MLLTVVNSYTSCKVGISNKKNVLSLCYYPHKIARSVLERVSKAFLLEILSEYSITIPELGTYRSEVKPIVVITSNRTRDLHDALKRRCFYHWVEHPDVDREVEIIRIRAPKVSLLLAEEVAKAAAFLRGMDLYKPPGVAETIDWAEALVTIGVNDLDKDSVDETLGTLIKYREDQERVRSRGFDEILSLVRQG